MNAPGLKGALLRRAVATKLENWRTAGEVKHTLYDALVFRKVRFASELGTRRQFLTPAQIRNLLGGELMSISSGAAPLSPDVHEMLKICFSCDVLQGVSIFILDSNAILIGR